MPCKRPDFLEYASVRDLYLAFEGTFLSETGSSAELISTCGHTIHVFDHHFFHLVKLDDPSKPKPLKMIDEKATILSTTHGFGSYTHEKQRAIYLRSALLTMLEPDEVWDDDRLKTARWIYIKEFDATPYSFTIMLIGFRGEDERRVPVTSFPGKPRDARKWRRGMKIYP
jgi:hypothetical protein